MKRKNWRSWLRLAAPYLLTALVPVLCVLFLGRTTLSAYQDKVIADRQSTVEAAFKSMQQKLDSIESLSHMLSSNDSITRFACSCLNRTGHTPLEFMELKSLFTTAKTNPVIHDIFLYDTKDNCVISTASATSNMDYFFRFVYRTQGHTLQERVSRLSQIPKSQHYCPSVTLSLSDVQGDVKQLVEYRVFLPLDWLSDYQSQLVVSMDAVKLFSEFNDTLHSEGEYYVYDNHGTLIYASGDQYRDLLDLDGPSAIHKIDAGEESLYGAVLRSSDRGWTVKIYMPDLLRSNTVSFISPAIWGLVVTPVVASILLTIFFTHTNYKGILELLELFRGHTGSQDRKHPREEKLGYRLVQEYAGQVISEKNRVTRQMSEYALSRKYEVLDKLVRSTYRSREEAAQALTESGLSLSLTNNLVLCICYADGAVNQPLSGEETLQSLLPQVLSRLIHSPYVLFNASARETVCVISLEEGQDFRLLAHNLISNLKVDIIYRHDLEILIGVGSPAPCIDQLGESYEQARAVIRYRELSGNRVNLYADLIALEDVYFYASEYNERIQDYLVAGKTEEAIKMVQRIYRENFVENGVMLSVRAIGTVKHRLWDCVVSIADKYGITPEQLGTPDPAQALRKVRGEISAQAYFDMICQMVERLGERIREKRATGHNALAGRILEHVRRHFCESELSLKQLSQALGVHENYISNLFKSTYNENLSGYVEKLRIEKASELIRGTSMTIERIAQEVGYTSAASFRRAFKKLKGVSPAEYREN